MAPRPTISVVLIVKNEQDVLARCLESVTWADEIVVYDTGSTDGTREVARRFTELVVEGYWDDDFAAARNRALAHASQQWVLSIDADEIFESRPSTLRKHLARGRASVYGLRIANEAETSLDQPYEFTATRVFTRADHHWGERLHEQVYDDAGRLTGGPVLAGIRLRHTGYLDGERLTGEKAARNVSIIRAGLEAAQREGRAGEVATARVHLARSLILAREWDQARAVGEGAWNPEETPEFVSEALAASMVELCLAMGDVEAAQVWVRRWQGLQPANVLTWAAAARVAERSGDPAGALAALEHVPTVSRDAAGGTVTRAAYAGLEVRLLVALERRPDAVRLVLASVRAATGVLSPVELLPLLGEEAIRAIVDELPDDEWRRWALRCAQAGDATALRVLDLMAQRREDDLAVLACAGRVAGRVGLQEAGEWSARLRRHGLAADCPLVALAANDTAPARDRALAAALAYSAYRDERALEHLGAALDRVPTQGHRALAAELEIVAPGLVSFD